jgi:regulation of enolase protein 1 (concanavalin A-like superfamily)
MARPSQSNGDIDMETNLTLQIVLAIAGSVALLIGLFGGGVKAKEIEVPKISVGPRILSSLVGIALIAMAIRLPYFAPPAESTPIPMEDPAPSTVEEFPPPTSPTSHPTDPSIDAPNMWTATQTPADTPIFTPNATEEPAPEVIPFGSLGNPGLLNAAFGWQAGGSTVNTYDLAAYANVLTLIAGGSTDQWAEVDSAPLIFYPLQGNFEAQVKVVFNPVWGHELAALGIRSTRDHNTWLRLGGVYAVFTEGNGPEHHIVLDVDDQGIGGKIRTSPYPANAVYLKIERKGSVFDFFYSEDGVNWTALITGYIAEMPANVEVFLTVGSWGDKGISAEFHNFTVLRK